MLHICWLFLVKYFQGCPCATYIAGIPRVCNLKNRLCSVVQGLFFGDELPEIWATPSPFVISLRVNLYVRFGPWDIGGVESCDVIQCRFHGSLWSYELLTM